MFIGKICMFRNKDLRIMIIVYRHLQQLVRKMLVIV